MISSPPVTWKKSRSVFVIVIALTTALTAHAAEDAANTPDLTDKLNLTGSLRGSYWNMDNNPTGSNNIGVGELWLKAMPQVGEEAKIIAEGWLRASNISGTTQSTGRLREGYLSFSQGEADFRIGKQIIVWGRADQINPTDNLSPRDNTLLFAETDDQRQGTTAVKATYHFTQLAATAIWLPQFSPNVQPIPPAPGVTFAENIPKGDQYALKLEQAGQDIDWSLSYFHGFDLNPDISIASPPPPALNLALRHHRIRVLGADAATVLGRFGVRSEIAYTWTEDAAGNNPFIKNPFLYGVVGADKTFLEYLNINAQYFARHISRYQNPTTVADPFERFVAIQQSIIASQQDRFQQGASLRISNKWFNETLDAELTTVYNATRGDYLLRPKIGYAFNDHWRGSLGANLFRGDGNTFFGLLKNRSAVFAEMRYGF